MAPMKLVRKAAILTGLASILVSSSANAADGLLEYEVKAVFLLNFTKFIEWPAAAFEAPDSPITICLLGEDPFGRTLDQVVNGEVVNGRKIGVQRIKRPPAAKSCQILFWGRSENAAARTLPALGPGVLTVGEGESFLHEGGMISFVIDNRRVRFDVNQTLAEKAGLKPSSKLLGVARSVEK
jgi:hypothetical protein